MNTNRVVHGESGRWNVEWACDGAVQGQAEGSYASEVDARIVAVEFARMERQEAARLHAMPRLQPVPPT